MKPNPLKRNLEEGGTALGTMVFEFATPGVARIAASAGAEFVVFDQEHSGWGIETIRMLMATARAAELVPLVRVPSTQHHFISRPLDVGASGVMVPMVETAEQASAVVTAAKYPPEGERGAAFGIGHDDYEAAEDVVSSMQQANDETLLIAQIETTDGIENVEEIAAVDGVDVLWIGHNDLTNSIGIPGQFDHPDYLRAVDRFLEACADNGKAPGIMSTSVEEARSQLDQGFRCVAYWGDIWLYASVLREGIERIREK
ncbi:MAG TPA: aldolase/citrate lyase family protein [Rubrobacter sp.]|nr:aldolase/citrate lyase family protein [Rubrobacter sp.]